MWIEMTEPSASPPAVRRVAELASQLAAIDPGATELVRELFKVFSEVQEHFRRPEPIDTAPREPGTPIFLFCPDQAGWQVGAWSPEGLPRWVATIDAATALRPSHWMRPAAAPEGDSSETANAA
jgi:hypothetical protein